MKRRCAIGKRRVMQMKKRLLCFTMLLTVTISAITFTNNVKAATKWNTSKSVTKEENGIKYSAYLTEDGKESWIYQIKLSKKITKLTLPKEINQAKLTRVGFGKELYNKGEDEDAYQNLFGDTIEPWHNCYGDLSNDDKNKQTIETVAIPSTVNQLEIATFSGMKKLKSVVIPEQTASVPAYTFAKCSALSKVTFSKNMNEIDSTAFVKSNQVKTFSCPKSNKTFAVKKGMLMTKSGKTLVLVPNKMKKIRIPTSVKTVKAKAFNGSQATSIVIPKSVKKIEAKALSSKKVTKVSLSSKNKIYKMANNCIYRKSDGLLVGVIAKTKKVSIPSKVKVIDDTVSVMGKIGTKNQVHIPKSVNKVVEHWMFYGDATAYFHGMKPPVIVSEYNGNEFTALPIFNKVYVPKKAKKTYIKWAKDRDGLTWHDLHTF